jgi:hypothetical protein
MAAERKQAHSLSPWLPLWCLVGTTSLLALVAGGHLLDWLWLLDSDSWAPALVPALVVAPLLLVPLTVGRRPGRGVSALVIALCLAVAALGLAARQVIAWTHASDGGWYHGPGGFYPLAASAPWQAWQAAALAYALCGVLLLGVYAVITVRGRAARSR